MLNIDITHTHTKLFGPAIIFKRILIVKAMVFPVVMYRCES